MRKTIWDLGFRMEFSLTFDGSRINPQTVTSLQMTYIALLDLLLLFHGKTFKTLVTFTSEIGLEEHAINANL